MTPPGDDLEPGTRHLLQCGGDGPQGNELLVFVQARQRSQVVIRRNGGVGDSQPASLSPATWERVRMGMTVIQQDRRQALYGVAISPALADIRSR